MIDYDPYNPNPVRDALEKNQLSPMIPPLPPSELEEQPALPLLEKYAEKLERVTFRLPQSTLKLMKEKIPRHRWGSFANECIRHFLK